MATVLAGGQMSASFGRMICCWTDKLPPDCREAADEILLGAAAAGMELAELAGLAREILDRYRPDLPDEDPGGGLEDRGVRLVTTFEGAGVLSGDLTPECAAVAGAVLDALSAPCGAQDTRTHEQRYHDALQEAMRRLCFCIMDTWTAHSQTGRKPSSERATFKDDGSRRFKEITRDGFGELIAAIEAGQVDVVIVRDIDPLTRVGGCVGCAWSACRCREQRELVTRLRPLSRRVADLRDAPVRSPVSDQVAGGLNLGKLWQLPLSTWLAVRPILWVSCGRHVWWSPWPAGSMAIDGGNLRPA